MDALIDVGVNPDFPRENLIATLSKSCTEGSLRNMRANLFDTALSRGLAHPKDVLVKRLKRAVGPTLIVKYATDIADLCYAIRNEQLIPRTLLKNGKRSATFFLASRSKSSSNCRAPHPDNTPQNPLQSNDGTQSFSNSPPPQDEQNEAITSLMRDLGSLRHDVTQLKSEVTSLRNISSSESCLLYVCLKNVVISDLCESLLNDILNCSSICHSIIRTASIISLRVRILTCHLHSALTSTNTHIVSVSLWKSSRTSTTPGCATISSGIVTSPTAQSDPSTTLTLTAWNCRGLRSGEPYIHQLAENGCDIIAVSEHWLWPYEADRLCHIHPAFTAEVKTDNRLTDQSTLRKGCGGVGLIWKKEINATPIPSISSDRICGIRIKSSSSSTDDITIIAVYLPCSDVGMECYSEHLIELEQVVSEHQPHGPVIIMGDFNAHLGTLGGERGVGQPNQQGILLHQLITRCNLYAVSQTSLSQGPLYTFQNDVSQTTVDYVIASHNATEYIRHCYTHDISPLNTSDHLPITAVLQFAHSTVNPQELSTKKRINWSKVPNSTNLYHYQKRVADFVAPLIGHLYNCTDDIDKEIEYVTENICSAALESLPLHKKPSKSTKWFKDQTLSSLALEKKAAWDRWSANGRPKEGPLYDAKNKARAAFRKRMKVCEANSERKRIQQFDHQFKQKSSIRFKIPTTKRRPCPSLRRDQEVVTDQKTILDIWEDHFRALSSTNSTATYSSEDEVERLMLHSLDNEDYLFDVPFVLEEVESVLKKLKLGKAAGHDGVQSEHLKFGGPTLRDWVLQICNAIVEAESIPRSLKTGIITPVYKGGGKDPLSTNSYRGITLTSVLAKVLEALILKRLQCHFSDRNMPHPNQTAYRKGVSCAEAIFSTMEVISTYSRSFEKVYMCFYDLQKAFDSIQYPVLLKRLYESGVNGKAWRLLRSWYTSPRSMVRVNGVLSSPFTLERGVLQGSVLSPVLFLLIMDPLLKSLQSKGLGLSVSETYAGGFIHADDIRTISSSRTTLQEQINTVCTFAENNGLTLNPTKCEVVLISPSKPATTAPIATVEGRDLVPQLNAKCLGYWWCWDLSATRAVDEAIKKARRAFFAFGAIGAFQGQLNPISGRSIYETCVIPSLLFGCENWVLTDSMLHKLEAFQGEIGRRILKLSKHHSTLSTRLGLRWPSVTARILISKLSLLVKLREGEDSIGSQIFSSVPQGSLSLVQECRQLEERLSCKGCTNSLLNSQSSLKEKKKDILRTDWDSCIMKASDHCSTTIAAQIARNVSWVKLWDMALDHGPRGTEHLQALYQELTRPQFQKGVCHLCESQFQGPYFNHFTLSHTRLPDPEQIISCLSHSDSDIFMYAKHFSVT